jgi:hypothetical protein
MTWRGHEFTEADGDLEDNPMTGVEAIAALIEAKKYRKALELESRRRKRQELIDMVIHPKLPF